MPVVGLVGNRKHFATRTRACRDVRTTVLTDDRLVDDLVRWGPELRGSVLVPCTDLSVALVAEHADRLEQFYLWSLPTSPVVDLLLDKVSFASQAEAAGVAVPATVVLRTRDDAVHAGERLRFPAVVKPPVKSADWVRHTAEKAIIVDDAAALLDVYERTHSWAPELLAQEWVAGGDENLFSCNAYFGSGSQPLVTFVARKVRQWPPDTGTSASGIECRNDEVLEQTIRLFTSLPYSGLAYLEVKKDARTGAHYAIEPNIGRPTGRSAIAEAGGVELLWTMYCDVTGRPLPRQRLQQYGDAKWMDLRRDLQSAVHDWRRGKLTPFEWIRWVRAGPVFHAVWSRSDPWPFALDLVQSARKAVTRAGGAVVDRARAASPGGRISAGHPAGDRAVD